MGKIINHPVLSIRQKLVLLYFLPMVMTIGLFSVVSYTRSAQIIERQTLHSADLLLRQANLLIESKLNNIIFYLDLIFGDEVIQEILTRVPETTSFDIQMRDLQYLRDLVSNIESNRDIHGVRFYIQDGFLFSNENRDIFSASTIQASLFFEKVIELDGKVFFHPQEIMEWDAFNRVQVISGTRLIKSRADFTNGLGIVSIYIEQSALSSILDKTRITNGSLVYLLDGDKVVLSTAPIREETLTPGARSKIEIEGEQYLSADIRNATTGWILYTLIPLRELFSEIDYLKYSTIGAVGVILLFSFCVVYVISANITKRIRQLTMITREVGENNLTIRVDVESGDEITELQKNFNAMIERLSQLMQEKYEMGQAMKETEMRFLQAQINPHFLYNTLEMINWMAFRHKAKDISSVIDDLSTFYKISLSNGKDVIPIQEEIRHALTYFEIQNRRFGGKIERMVIVDAKLYEYSIVKMLLQPLVENAMFHGIRERESKAGKIELYGFFEDDDIILGVRDDGVGMEEKRAAQILSMEATGASNGYGLLNVHERIKLYYGAGYGLSITSRPGVGTNVMLRVAAYRTDSEE